MIVLHAAWTSGGLHLWAEDANASSVESLDAPASEPTLPQMPPLDAESTTGENGYVDQDEAEDAPTAVQVIHVRYADARTLSGICDEIGVACEPASVTLRLPAVDGQPLPSPRLAHSTGAAVSDRPATGLASVEVQAVRIEPDLVADCLERLLDSASRLQLLNSPEIGYFAQVGRLTRRLLAHQRFVPALRQDASGDLTGSWQAWLADEQTAEDAASLVAAMPPAARAVEDALDHEPAAILDDMIGTLTNATARQALSADGIAEVLEGRDTSDVSVGWLTGLLGEAEAVAAPDRRELIKGVRSWIGRLEERGASTDWMLCLRLNEPMVMPGGAEPGDDARPAIVEPADAMWSLSFHLQPVGVEDVLVDAADIWLLAGDTITLEGRRLDKPQELLLAELGRASRLYKPLERALNEAEPVDVQLTTTEAYEFLREIRPLLREQGFGVQEPAWFGSATSRLGARLLLDSDPSELDPDSGASGATGPSQLGLDALVTYQWQIAVGETTLTLREFEALAERKSPLVQINGRWVEIRPEDVEAAVKFIRENPGGQMAVGEAIRMAFSTDVRNAGLNVIGLETSGWLADVFGGSSEGEALPLLEQPEGFKGTLRPYQLRGYSWLNFLERFGFGACLADDMGLGKTIQLLARFAHEREEATARGDTVKPTLLIVPTSVVGNWMHEANRFTPSLRVMIHHGSDRHQGDAFIQRVAACDLVITTYALANRDQDLLGTIKWGRLVLDEAQFIKNPAAKQSQAVRNIPADRRVALTGTPVENRLSELWSIMDFLNPGYLGPPGTFRKKFAVPIERYRDEHRGRQLRALVRPFVLRRLKTDPKVVGDLPPKVESREYTHLTSEQAELYESTVKRMLTEVDQAEGMRRRGIVLSALVQLKQICNHPAQALKEFDKNATAAPSAARSGKTTRLIEMLDEILAAGDQALIFSQFRQMGHILAVTLRHALDREVLFLHGGTPRTQRQKLVEEFQRADGSAPIMLVSLRAGGVGLNLTAANHVFHFDRWWNPAVENQATDRAYRIGQTRTVQVHKFVCRGTLEERIDEMLEQKTELAEQIVGSGEQWLTELDTNALKELLTLRDDAVGEE
ncbi:MAG: DEAD/DEAH box helicase [Planctomycetota bacterium]